MLELKIAGTTVFFHAAHHMLFLSPQKSMTTNLICQIVLELIVDKEKYNIQNPDKGFDVFVLHENRLRHYMFKASGQYESAVLKGISKNGLFYLQFKKPETLIDVFSRTTDFFKIERYSFKEDKLDRKTKNQLLTELRDFVKAHFFEYWKTWNLSLGAMNNGHTHFFNLLSATDSLYLIRDAGGQIKAIYALSATDDHRLIYQSLAVTHRSFRGKGLMATLLDRVSYDYPNAIMIAFLEQSKIRHSLNIKPISYSSQLMPTNRLQESDRLRLIMQARHIKQETEMPVGSKARASSWPALSRTRPVTFWGVRATEDNDRAVFRGFSVPGFM